MKHRIEKGKLIDITGVTRALFDRVVAHMDKILSDVLSKYKLQVNVWCAMIPCLCKFFYSISTSTLM